KKTLPDYMLPNAFVILEKMPLTINGKIDKKALMQLEISYINTLAHYIAPRSPEDQDLINIWAEVLKINPVSISIHDNFFALGGHSLLAIQVIARARALFQVELSLADLFNFLTVEDLIDHIHSLRMKGQNKALTPPPLMRRPTG